LAEDPPLPNPEKPVDYVAWINAQYSKGIKENAADVYREALDAFVEDERALEIASRMDKPWRDYERGKLQRCLDRNEQCLSRFAAAANMPRCYFERESASGSVIEVLMPSPKPFRGTAKMLAGRARLRLAAGETDAAVTDVGTLLRAARHMQSQPSLIEYLVGVAVQDLACDLVIHLPEIAADSVDYEAVLKSLRRADRTPRPPDKQLQGERTIFLDVLQRYFKDEDGDGRLDQVRDVEGMPPIELGTGRTIEFLIDEYDGFLKRWQKVMRSEYVTAQRLQEGLAEELAARKRTPVGVFMPNYWRVIQLHKQLLADRSAARIILRTHAFQAKHGRWPKDLKETGAPSSIRKDPFSDRDLVYRVKDGKPLIYSVGLNGMDDGGLSSPDGKPWGKDGDRVFWPPAGK